MYFPRVRQALPKSPVLYRSTSTNHSTNRDNSKNGEDQTMCLSDGRTLGYAEYGNRTGYPLIYFHGYPSSRLEGKLADKIAKRLDIHLISPDRPGFGLSTPQHGRKLTDWPGDVKSLANHLGLSRFALLGGSGGSPYVLACAHALPSHMLSSVGIMAGAGPWEAGSHYMMYSYRMAAWAAEHWPRGLGLSISALVWIIRTALSSQSKSIDNWLKKSNPEGGLTVSEQRKQLARLLLEGFAQGVEPSVHEAYLLTHDWGIPFEDIAYDPILLWHGSNDRNAPIEMVEYMADRLPHGLLHTYEGETHFTLNDHLEEILTKLIPPHIQPLSREPAP